MAIWLGNRVKSRLDYLNHLLDVKKKKNSGIRDQVLKKFFISHMKHKTNGYIQSMISIHKILQTNLDAVRRQGGRRKTKKKFSGK